MTLSKTYNPFQGLSEITDATLAYSHILMVARSGVVFNYTDVDGTLVSGSPFYQYTPSAGTITFNPNIPFNENETINVVYETI
jgi:prophage tail gpP-like protein